MFAVAFESIRKHAAVLDDPELEKAFALAYDFECFGDDAPEPIADILSSYAIASPSPPSNEDHYIDLLLASYDEDVESEMAKFEPALFHDKLYNELYELAEQKLARRLGRFVPSRMVFDEQMRLKDRVRSVEIAFKNCQKAAFSFMP